MTFDKKAYDNDFLKKNYKQINFRIRNEDMEQIRAIAAEEGYKTVPEYVRALLDREIAAKGTQKPKPQPYDITHTIEQYTMVAEHGTEYMAGIRDKDKKI